MLSQDSELLNVKRIISSDIFLHKVDDLFAGDKVILVLLVDWISREFVGSRAPVLSKML